jgi:hypothetical protein
MQTILLLAVLFTGAVMLAACTGQQMANGKDQHSSAIAVDTGSAGGGGGY